MKSVIVLLCVVFAVASAVPVRKISQADQSRNIRVLQALKAFKVLHVLRASTRNDTVQFIEGVALGLAADFGNVTECTKEGTTVIDDFDKAYTEIKNGFAHMNVPEIAAGLVDFGAGLDELAAALSDCGEEQLVADIANLAKYLSEGPKGILELIAKEILNFFNQENTLGYDYKRAIAAWDADPRDYKTAGFYTGEIIGIFLDIQ
eukprot:TRINITY_DN1403_c0_g1_i1.p1 TRINITY_DN1403_c0_g1~~TRINITY_DN1403_c0_g1_i1.p1  ORF type:complete len:205 (-),score=87.87 TRINITY_DN1403_c0_g1_i1:515-1129(-)